MNEQIESIMKQEYEARADLREAQETYRLASLEVRKNLGAIFKAKRESLNLSASQCAGLLGVVRQKVFSTENPEKVENPFGTDSYLEMIRAIDELARISEMLPKVRRGRLLGGKNKAKD
jgi:hypothetical protein